MYAVTYTPIHFVSIYQSFSTLHHHMLINTVRFHYDIISFRTNFQDGHYYNYYVLKFLAISGIFLMKRPRVKNWQCCVYRKHWEVHEMLSSFGLRWWQQMLHSVLHQHFIAGEIIGCRKTVLTPRIQLCLTDPSIPFKLRRRRFPIKNDFVLPIN
jgi:hypothetical protein